MHEVDLSTGEFVKDKQTQQQRRDFKRSKSICFVGSNFTPPKKKRKR